jgi:hypothetical protein
MGFLNQGGGSVQPLDDDAVIAQWEVRELTVNK